MIFVNRQKVGFEQFPNGETHITKETLKSLNTVLIAQESIEIVLYYENDRDLINLIFLKDYLDENFYCEVYFTIPYLPYSRMDRTEGQTIFTLKSICKLINNMKFKRVLIHEPHSDVGVALLDRVDVRNVSSALAKNMLMDSYGKLDIPTYLVYPDAGAEKRYSKQIKYDKVLTCSKERDFTTGYINKLDINGSIPNEPFRAIIVDDLCSRGGTFMMTAQKLKEIGAEEIVLVITHCEKTILEGDIFKTDLIDKVVTTNSIIQNEDIKGIEKVIIKDSVKGVF